MTTIISKYGKIYEHPDEIDENRYYELIHEFISLAQAKGLTVRQAQKLFTDCTDAVLCTKL